MNIILERNSLKLNVFNELVDIKLDKKLRDSPQNFKRLVYDMGFPEEMVNEIRNIDINLMNNPQPDNYKEILNKLKSLGSKNYFTLTYIKPRNKAKIYNNSNSMIFTSFPVSEGIEERININEEICVSTFRSNTIFYSANLKHKWEAVSLIGQGNLRLLYDYDAWTDVTKTGIRIPVYDQFLLTFNDAKSKKNSEYYDEGIIHPKNINWLCLALDSKKHKHDLKSIYESCKALKVRVIDMDVFINKVLRGGKLQKFKNLLKQKKSSVKEDLYEEVDVDITDEILKTF